MSGPVLGSSASAPGLAARRPGRAVETRVIDGVYQAAIWDLGSGERRVITDHPHGVDLSEIEPDGEFI